ncbi:LacI family transcriptional regulator [Micromonospora sp. PPF5-17]|uniref:LacI family transcriptional regulator n=1 Tax=Micromonospora solifontis TaxID=2487138 RepID=A0ABX9WEQ0_9ACTN|nr:MULTISPECIES: LacI family DNA-binding transcriptional regulator [Micromonospora]NES38286.1 LacI family transcriptional regulator [Micromonospora solifontis]NES58677.1 LacI family transcriptional regulator [Micromonospora sp. PPF5-6]RNL96354.1 LacI family transcriptional regulator [Micromonospora solifontis]
MTIAYIAESAGVSVPTVSKVINGHSGVAADTRARVEALISRYGYRKPALVRRSQTLELVFDELGDMWGVEIIRGVERVAREHRLGVVLTEFGPQRNSIRYWIDDTLTRRPACVVTVAQLSEEQRNRLRARGIPFVVFDPTVELPDDVPFVGATNWAGGRSATRHLVELGHRRIAMIAGPQGVLCCQARLDGYRSALEAAGLPIETDLVVRAGLTREDGCAAARELLSRPRRPTAIFASNDLQALGIYQAARALGLTIPGDLSVVGFDDLPVATLVDPPLTTIRQPLTEMAVAATELALALGRGERAPQVGLELATTLSVRGSTARRDSTIT